MKAILYVLLLINCSLCLAQTRRGTHTIQRESNAAINEPILSGSVVELATNKPLRMAIVKIDTTLIYTDTLGHFRYALPVGKYRIRAGFIGYYLIDLGKIRLHKGELVHIVFRVKEDLTPLID
ncbi:peptidase associated/transthyretin-like domain-containing protein [Spirosoma koreense]